ncbi:exonuclease/endonuclease/phosphatase family protein [Neorhodopirellula lusitana]|uniref:deoxyribonuclease I n=1 Tax=Neorhodopirellula lusitana TaxID=445327 RepID=UPI00384B19A5
MSDNRDGGHPLQAGIIVLLLVGGGWYFFRNYNVDGLDGVRISSKENRPFDDLESPFTFTSSTEEGTTRYRGASIRGDDSLRPSTARPSSDFAVASDFEPDPIISSPSDIHSVSRVNSLSRRSRYAPAQLRVASWALDGFGPTKLASDLARKNLVRVIRQFDVIALQQISSLQMDLVPRMIDAINESSLGGGAPLYDYVLGPPTGPKDRGEQMAILFNPARVRVDRSQTYTVADPDNQMTYDPLVAWFRAAEPDEDLAWTFTMVNIRVDLSRAPREVALINQLFKSVREDGRGEDDVVIAGLFQADDAYLLPVVAGPQIRAAVTSTPTDIFGRHQTSNLLYDQGSTAEAIGRGGVYDFLRVYNLSAAQAQAVSSYLPVYAEFSPLEGSPLLHQATVPATTPR